MSSFNQLQDSLNGDKKALREYTNKMSLMRRHRSIWYIRKLMKKLPKELLNEINYYLCAIDFGYSYLRPLSMIVYKRHDYYLDHNGKEKLLMGEKLLQEAKLLNRLIQFASLPIASGMSTANLKEIWFEASTKKMIQEYLHTWCYCN